MQILDVRNPKYADAGHTLIDMEVLIGEEWHPFTASASDPEEHGRVLHAAAMAGEFGEIEDFTA